VGDAVASSKRSGKSTGLLLAGAPDRLAPGLAGHGGHALLPDSRPPGLIAPINVTQPTNVTPTYRQALGPNYEPFGRLNVIGFQGTGTRPDLQHFPSLHAGARPRAGRLGKSKAVAGRQGRTVGDRPTDPVCQKWGPDIERTGIYAKRTNRERPLRQARTDWKSPGNPLRKCSQACRVRFIFSGGAAMLIGYVRVSKSDGSQTLAPQRDAMLAAGVDPARIY
jgi:hypothetical protein